MKEKKQREIYLVPNMREYLFDPQTGSVRIASQRGIPRAERKAEEKAARRARKKKLKAGGKHGVRKVLE